MNFLLTYPMIALVAWTFIIWVQMYVVRVWVVKREGLRVDDLHKNNPTLPKSFRASGDNFSNLLELPILFYLGISVLIYFDLGDDIYLGLTWAFVGLRVIHSIIHTSYNKIMHRFLAYVSGGCILWFLWFRLAWELLT